MARPDDDARVAGCESAVYVVPTDSPEADGTLSWSSTTAVVVTVRAGGVEGVGYTYGPRSCATLVDDVLAECVLGADAMDVAASWLAMVRRVRNIGRPGVAAMAISAVDTAMWDLKARLLGKPLSQLLGRVRAAVPAYGSGGFTTYDDGMLRAQLERWVDELGAQAVKIKIGESWGTCPRRDVARVRLTRETVGDDVEVFVDANGGYGVAQARRLGHEYDRLGVTWFEEPVSSDDLDGLASLRGALRCDIAAGEYGYDLAYFGRMCGAGAVDCVQVDVTRCGGVTEWLRVAALAAAHSLDVSAHCAPSLHAAPAASIPNLRHVEFFHDHERVEGLLFDGAATMKDGALHMDGDRRGNGLRVRSDATRWRTA